MEEIYAGIKAPTIRTSIRAAEMVKYSDNAFHALKVTFANEIGNICKRLGIDSHAVMDIFCQDTKLNLSKVYLKPGFAFGGSCLPKDLRALSYQAKRTDVDVPVLNAILQSNVSHIKGVIQRIVGLGKKRVGFLGMTFKPDTDDLRESPLGGSDRDAPGKRLSSENLRPERGDQPPDWSQQEIYRRAYPAPLIVACRAG